MATRPMREDEVPQVLLMMQELWPDERSVTLDDEHVIVWQRPEGGLGGFVSLSIRPTGDGCESAPVPWVEGWWVARDLRRTGVGRQLIGAAEAWALAQGFDELGSDTLLQNRAAIAAHQQIGFEPTEQLQMFRKRLR